MTKLGRIVQISGGKYAAERIAAGLNQQQLAERLGVTPGYVSKIERAMVKGVYLKHLTAMAEVLKVPISEAVRRLSADLPDPFKASVGEPVNESNGDDGKGKPPRRAKPAARRPAKPSGQSK
jgi:transcriptional regulator with XRE-family HTH domain